MSFTPGTFGIAPHLQAHLWSPIAGKLLTYAVAPFSRSRRRGDDAFVLGSQACAIRRSRARVSSRSSPRSAAAYRRGADLAQSLRSLDRDSILALSHQPGGSPLFLTPLGLGTLLQDLAIENVKELDWWQCHKHRGVDFHCTPAQHWSGRGLYDRDRTLWCAWAVLGADFHWFFSGDAGYSQDFTDTRRHFADRQGAEQVGGVDMALIAVGACLPRWFMSMQHVDLAEAVQVHLDLGAKHRVGVHWGAFSLADEPLDQPIHELDSARRAKGVAETEFWIMPIGGTRCISPRSIRYTATHLCINDGTAGADCACGYT